MIGGHFEKERQLVHNVSYLLARQPIEILEIPDLLKKLYYYQDYG